MTNDQIKRVKEKRETLRMNKGIVGNRLSKTECEWISCKLAINFFLCSSLSLSLESQTASNSKHIKKEKEDDRKRGNNNNNCRSEMTTTMAFLWYFLFHFTP